MRNWLLSILIILTVTTVNANTSPCDSQSCLAVVDAGSTGSRLHIYAYDLEHNHPTHVKEIYSKRLTPGIASIELRQISVNQYLQRLFTNIPTDNLTVYFYSTGGMRLLPYYKQQAYYALITQWFNSQEHLQLNEAKTITGKEEGVLAWLAVNYDAGQLYSPNGSPIGVMDTGGASVQIAFPVTNPESVKAEDRVELELNGKTIHLFVHSFLGLGQTEFDHQFLEDADCFPHGYPLPNGAAAHGDFLACEHETSQLVNTRYHVNTLVQPIVHSNPGISWTVIGGLNYLLKNNLLSFHDDEFQLQQLATQVNSQICQQDWTTLLEQSGADDHLFNACLNASYYYSLIVDGYGLNDTQPIHYSSNLDNNDWTLGVVLHQP
jgi:hypothetical protein